MKTEKAVRSRAKRKAGAEPATVDKYIEHVPEPAHGMISSMRAAIRSVMPEEATETISYGVPAFKLKKVLVWYAAFQNHCSLFPGAAVIEAFGDELSGYTISKGTVQFPLTKRLPTALIKKLVKARLERS